MAAIRLRSRSLSAPVWTTYRARLSACPSHAWPPLKPPSLQPQSAKRTEHAGRPGGPEIAQGPSLTLRCLVAGCVAAQRRTFPRNGELAQIPQGTPLRRARQAVFLWQSSRRLTKITWGFVCVNKLSIAPLEASCTSARPQVRISRRGLRPLRLRINWTSSVPILDSVKRGLVVLTVFLAATCHSWAIDSGRGHGGDRT